MSLKRSELFARWGDLQHAQDENAEAPGWADRDHAIGLARDAYLDAVRFGAVEDERVELLAVRRLAQRPPLAARPHPG